MLHNIILTSRNWRIEPAAKNKMTQEELDTKLAIELFGRFCGIYEVELTDLVYIAGKMKQADDLKGVSLIIHHGDHTENWAENIALKATYKGTDTFWTFKCLATNEGRVSTSDVEVEKYFQDLGQRVGLQFQNARHSSISGSIYKYFGDGTVEIPREATVKISADAIAPSGKTLQVRVSQFYTPGR